jgi:hypothetical protein
MLQSNCTLQASVLADQISMHSAVIGINESGIRLSALYIAEAIA